MNYFLLILITLSLGAQQKKFDFFTLPTEIQNEIVDYVVSDPAANIFLYNKNFNMSENVAYKLVSEKAAKTYSILRRNEALVPCGGPQIYGWGHADEFIKCKKLLFKRLRQAFLSVPEHNKKKLLTIAYSYISELKESYKRVEVPLHLGKNFSKEVFVFASDNLSAIDYTSIHINNRCLDTFFYPLTQILLLHDKLYLCKPNLLDNNIIKNMPFKKPLFTLRDSEQIKQLADGDSKQQLIPAKIMNFMKFWNG